MRIAAIMRIMRTILAVARVRCRAPSQEPRDELGLTTGLRLLKEVTQMRSSGGLANAELSADFGDGPVGGQA